MTNQSVIRLLRRSLKRAREGKADFVIILTSNGPTESSYYFAGRTDRECLIFDLLDKFQTMMPFAQTRANSRSLHAADH
jgi:hypothetical protein